MLLRNQKEVELTKVSTEQTHGFMIVATAEPV